MSEWALASGVAGDDVPVVDDGVCPVDEGPVDPVAPVDADVEDSQGAGCGLS